MHMILNADDDPMAIAQEERVAAPAENTSYGDFIRHHMREYGILFALVAIMAFFQFMTDGVLLKPVNLTNLVLQNSYIVIMAVGMLLVIVSGHIDLSVGSVSGFIGALAAVLMVTYASTTSPRRRSALWWAWRSARRKAIGSPITASRPSS